MISIQDFWHGPAGDAVGSVVTVESRREERLSAVAGVAATAAVGVGALLAGPTAASGTGSLSAASWWAAYVLYLAAFAVDADLTRWRPRWATDVRLLAVELVAGAVAWLAAPGFGWTAVLFVVTAASAAYTLTARGALAVVVAQSAVVALGTALDGRSAMEVVVATAVYGSFQGFAVLVVGSEQREVAARTELAAAHAELRAASVLLAASTRSAERLRISRDLHDVVGHQLTALALELEVASHRCDGEAAGHVTRARTIAKDLLRDVRGAVGDLRRGSEDLESTLRELVTDLPGLTVDLTVDETVDESAPLDEASAFAVVRCVQEILTNTLRHADADHLTIGVVIDEAGVRLDARDDGHGTEHLVWGNGLNGLRERVEQLGGTVALRTAAGHGFAVIARVPAR
jgi:signal transduction histidine kinase